MTVNRQYLLRARPVGRIQESDFEYREQPVPEPKDGEVLVRSVYLSLDPAMRGWMNEGKSYVPPVPLGAVMRGIATGVVEESRHPDFKAGDKVSTMIGWQDYGAVPGEQVEKLIDEAPMTASASVLGMTGRTAYFGLLDIGQPRDGETVVVSGAAGAVGSVVGQIAKIKGCRVVGIAGSAEKCRWITEELGFDAAVNYREGDLFKQLKAACPDGVDVFFDNVGGETLDTMLRLINVGARIPFCGAISVYNATEPQPGPYNYRSILVNRAKVQGFIVFDFEARYAEATRQLWEWVRDGRIRYTVDVVDGLESAPTAINRLFEGANTGKLLVRVSPEPES